MIRFMMIAALAATIQKPAAAQTAPGSSSWLELGKAGTYRKCWESGSENGNSSTRECETVRYVYVRECWGVWRDPGDTRGWLADSTLGAETENVCGPWVKKRDPRF
jgi:hypothetical protein